MRQQVNQLGNIFVLIFQRLQARLRYSREDIIKYTFPRVKIVGSVGFIGFPLYYFVWRDWFPQPYENLPLRLIGSLVCLSLLLIQRLPERFYFFLWIYVCIVFTYILPFFFTLMLLYNGCSTIWAMSLLSSIFLLLFIINDWLILILVYLIGSLMAWVSYFLTVGDMSILYLYLSHTPIYLFIFVVGMIFNHRSVILNEEKFQALSGIGANIAHELRTPLLSIKSAASGIGKYIEPLYVGYRQAQEHGLAVPKIRKNRYERLASTLDSISEEVDQANTVIDILLFNLQTSSDTSSFDSYLMSDCIKQALERFPFSSPVEQAKVHWNRDKDFIFLGSDILMVHLLMNLLKNALYAIAKVGQGEVYISLECDKQRNRNYLYFKDTGPGISKTDLRRIFAPFYSSKPTGQGSGIGLTFCKMVMQRFSGSISCESRLNEYTKFILTFQDVAHDS